MLLFWGYSSHKRNIGISGTNETKSSLYKCYLLIKEELASYFHIFWKYHMCCPRRVSLGKLIQQQIETEPNAKMYIFLIKSLLNDPHI